MIDLDFIKQQTWILGSPYLGPVIIAHHLHLYRRAIYNLNHTCNGIFQQFKKDDDFDKNLFFFIHEPQWASCRSYYKATESICHYVKPFNQTKFSNKNCCSIPS